MKTWKGENKNFMFEIFLKDEYMPTVDQNLVNTFEEFSKKRSKKWKLSKDEIRKYNLPFKKSKKAKDMKTEINEFLRHSLSKPVFEYEIEPSAPSSWISSL